jgi:AraC-like DNA-binding protein
MKKELMREITPLTQNDCFTLSSRVKSKFDFPLHFHDEYELNFISGAKGAMRVVGDHMEKIEDLELVLVGPNIQHAWFDHHCECKNIQEITIQFHKDLLDENLLRRNQLSFIKNMFDKSARGILFSRETILALAPRILALNQKHGFDSVLELISILHDLSISRNLRILSDAAFTNNQLRYHSRRIDRAFEFMNKNFDKTISLSEISKLSNMSDVSFSRFFRKKTGNTFVDSLTEIRLGHASRILIESSKSIAEVAYHSGFNNISNFNRIFKKKKGCTPREFRDSFSGTRIFI